MAVHFYYEINNFKFQNRRKLKSFLPTIFSRYGKDLEILDYIFCSDDYLLDINRIHLNHDFYTDIVTFDLSEFPGFTIGEIYISVDRVRDNAKKLKVDFYEELHRVIFHGALHLCGLKDKSKSDQIKMRAAEDALLVNYFK